MDVAPPQVLIEQVRSLPGAAALLQRLPADPPAYLVGGAVRDLLLGRIPRELDVVVEGDARVVAAALGEVVRAHERFGTFTVDLAGRRYDLARARCERYARPGALPTITPGSLEEDLRRRDFTVNALAIALNGPGPGRLITVSAPEQGLDALGDLDAGRLRVLHAESFRDDPTRLLRLARYAARLGFAVEAATARLVRTSVDDGALETVSGTRIGAEVRLLAREPDPAAALEQLAALGLAPALELGDGGHAPGLVRRALALLPDDGRRDLTALAAGWLNVPAARLEPLLDRLAFPAADRTVILRAAAGADAMARRLAHAASDSEIDRAIAQAPPEQVALAGALGAAEAAARWLERLRHIELEISGDDLAAAGVPRGPAIGAGLRAARAAKLDGTISGREQELSEALRAAGRSG